MKKTLLLSAVASTIAFAGGDIAPVQPVVPAAAPAACDFWGSIGARYEFIKKTPGANKWGKEDNTWKTTLVLGVEKELGYGFGIGAEVAATTDLGLDIADDRTAENAELSELYLTYKYGNTAVKAGRQALPKAVSPFAWTDTTVGRKDVTYNGVVVVNTDIADTTLVGAWIKSAAVGNKNLRIGDQGIFALGVINKSLENLTLSATAYYAKDSAKAAILKNGIVSVWAAAETKVDNFDLGLQVAYAKEKTGGASKTLAVAGYVGTNFNGLGAKLTAAYIDDGQTSLRAADALTSGFWGDSGYTSFGGDVVAGAGKQKIVRLDLDYKIDGYGTIYGGGIYDKADVGKAYGARLGYKFTIKGVNAKVEYRYAKKDGFAGKNCKKQTIRIEGVYKF